MGLRERIQDAKTRTNSEGLAVSVGIAGLANVSVLPIEGALITAIHEFSKSQPTSTGLIVVAISVAANALSIYIESKALREKGYAASPGGTVLNAATGKPLGASLLDHATNFGLLTVLNPINAVAVYNNDQQLLAESLLASSLTIPSWNIPFNQLIVEGKVDAAVDKIKSITEPPKLEPTTNIDYHRFQRNIRSY